MTTITSIAGPERKTEKLYKMNYYLAPLEGITSYTVRCAFAKFFPGADKYFTPFIPASKKFSKKIKEDLAPQNNEGLFLVPQVISNKASEMPGFEEKLAALGYEEYNLNLGCPSGTVVSKNRGSGFLRDVEALDAFLYEVYSNTKMRLSVKTRIGFESEDEWGALLEVFLKYPMAEFIVHPRLRSDQYKGPVRFDAYEKADEAFYREKKRGLCYNGDIVFPKDLDKLDGLQATESVMIGRGAFKRPWIFTELKTGKMPDNLGDRVFDFTEYTYEGFLKLGYGERDVIMHLKEIWGFLADSFDISENGRNKKHILKSKNRAEYICAVKQILQESSND